MARSGRFVTTKLVFGALGAAAALAAMGGVSLAQDAAAKAAAALPATGAPAASDPAALAKGRDLFTNYGCGSCHTLGDAGATGHVGPSLDGDSNLTQDFVAQRIANGQGVMPSFAGQLSQDEINALAAYVVNVAAK